MSSISRFNTLDLLWIPGHCGVEENEISDGLAKEVSTSPMPGPESAIGVSVALTDAAMKSWEQASRYISQRVVTLAATSSLDRHSMPRGVLTVLSFRDYALEETCLS